MQQFKDFLKANQIDYTDADVAGSADWIKSNIKAELVTSQFGQLEGLKVLAETDPEIVKADVYAGSPGVGRPRQVVAEDGQPPLGRAESATRRPLQLILMP